MSVNQAELIILAKKLRQAYSRETAYYKNQKDWSEQNSTCGQCAITALIVQENFGGTIHRIKVGDETHFFNIIDGEIIDFTKEQFDFKNINVVYDKNEEVDREEIFNPDSRVRYNLLKQRMNNLEKEEIQEFER